LKKERSPSYPTLAPLPFVFPEEYSEAVIFTFLRE
jgi:hypothetical protein